MPIANTDDDGPERQCLRIEAMVREFRDALQCTDHRTQVVSLVPIFHALRHLGRTLQPECAQTGARDRILTYLLSHPHTVIDGDELLVVSGIQEYGRRLRELRVELGWNIASGVTMAEGFGESASDTEDGANEEAYARMMPSQYVLLSVAPDLEAAGRWQSANQIRKGHGTTTDRLLCYLRDNVGRAVTSEELRYVAGDSPDWAAKIRDLRVRHGWPIASKFAGRPDLGTGQFVLEADRQAPAEERGVQDEMRKAVLRRDSHICRRCGWRRQMPQIAGPPRYLCIHLIGAPDTEAGWQTICNVCHDALHAFVESDE